MKLPSIAKFSTQKPTNVMGKTNQKLNTAKPTQSQQLCGFQGPK